MSADENKPAFIFYFYFLILFYQLKYIGLIQEFGGFCAKIVVLLIQFFYTKENSQQLIRPSCFHIFNSIFLPPFDVECKVSFHLL